MLNSLHTGYRSIVIGASGSIGEAFAVRLRAESFGAQVAALNRGSDPPIDYDREDSIAAAAEALRDGEPWHLLLIATGMLHAANVAPEKRLADLAYAPLETVFRTNVFGPALVLRHFAPLLDPARCMVAVLSAKVGSIGDNRLGGWYAYRASKAALNMVVKTAAIEMKRTHPGSCVVALHPGTVTSALSRPFRGDTIGRPPALAAEQMLAVLDTLGPEDTGSFIAWDGERLPW